MSKMSNLHAESAPERAEYAEGEVSYLQRIVEDQRAENIRLRQENAALKAENVRLRDVVLCLTEDLDRLKRGTDEV
jgi:hypothetical protein